MSESDDSQDSRESRVTLTPEQRTDLREAFNLFKGKNNVVDEKDLSCIMKCMGYEPKAGELLWLVTEVDRDESGFLDLNQVEELMSMVCLPELDSLEDVLNAFRILDEQKEGVVEVKFFKNFMSSYGTRCKSKKDKKIVDSMLEGNERKGMFYYEEMVEGWFNMN